MAGAITNTGGMAKAGESVLAQAGYVDTAMAEVAGDFVTRHGKEGKPWFFLRRPADPPNGVGFPPGDGKQR